MLNTIKQMKRILDSRLNLGESLNGGKSNIDFSKEQQITEKFIVEHKDEIKSWILEKSRKDGDTNLISRHEIVSEDNLFDQGFMNIINLAGKLGVFSEQLGHYDVNKLLGALDRFAGEKTQANLVSSEQRRDLGNSLSGSSINIELESLTDYGVESQASIIDSFNLDKYKDGRGNIKLKGNSFDSEVKKLQAKLLKKGYDLGKYGADGYFGRMTYDAIMRERGTQVLSGLDNGQKNNVILSQFSGNASEAPVFAGKASYEQASYATKKLGETIDTLYDKLRVTKELNSNLSKYLFADKRGYSIENLLRSTFSDGKYSEILTDKQQREFLLSQPGSKKKLGKAMEYLRGFDRKNKEGEYTRTTNSEIIGFVDKAWPWLGGIYLGDIPLLFIKEMVPGVDINKSVYFVEWLNKGMPGEFSDFYNTHKGEQPNIVSGQMSLIDILSRANLSSDQEARVLKGDLGGLDGKTRSLLLYYVENSLIPNLEALRYDNFNFFERTIFRDSKDITVAETIDRLKNVVKTGNLQNMPEIISALEAINKEDHKNEGITRGVDRGYAYMGNISANNKIIQERFPGLLELGKESFNKYNRIFALENLADLKNYGPNLSDQGSIDSLLSILTKNPINKNELSSWEKSNPSTNRFIEALGEPDKMKNYLVSMIPSNSKLKYVNVGFSKHGRDLSGLSNNEALRAAENETPKKGSNISTLGYAYKSFIEKGDISGISYDEFRNAFANKTNIGINQITNQPILNTSKNTNAAALTSFAELARRNGDKEVFKLSPIVKNYSYYEGGTIVDVRVSYDLYMRPNCTNPLIVPSSINATKNKRPVPKEELISLTTVKGKLPIFIPWATFIKPPKPVDTSINFDTTPGVNVVNEVSTVPEVVGGPSSVGGVIQGSTGAGIEYGTTGAVTSSGSMFF